MFWRGWHFLHLNGDEVVFFDALEDPIGLHLGSILEASGILVGPWGAQYTVLGALVVGIQFQGLW